MAMASLLSLALFLALAVSPSYSRTFTPSSRVVSHDAKPSHFAGPIQTNGKIYHQVCDPSRYQALKLNMNDFAYCNKNLSYYDRVDDLIGRMTLDEKVHQISDGAYGVDRIALPAYKWWSEILHGVSDVGQGGGDQATWFGPDIPGATSFPEAILSAASFNESLWKTMAEVIIYFNFMYH